MIRGEALEWQQSWIWGQLSLAIGWRRQAADESPAATMPAGSWCRRATFAMLGSQLLIVQGQTLTTLTACLSCGTPARSATSTFCGRCGRPFGAEPPAHIELPVCPVCYRSSDDDGRFPSAALPGLRLDLPRHIHEHEQHPVGDDDYLESLREGTRIRIGRWTAPFDIVRRYLVTGSLDGGRRRQFEHDLIVTAMTQLARFGRDAVILGDQPEWRAARDAVADLMERFHQPRQVRRRA